MKQFFWYKFIKTLFEQDKEIAEYTKTKIQHKALTGEITSTGDITALGFNNLEVGKWYRFKCKMRIQQTINNSAKYCYSYIYNGSTTIDRNNWYEAVTDGVWEMMQYDVTFKAVDTTVRVNISGLLNCKIYSASADYDTNSSLEELPNHEETTQWT